MPRPIYADSLKEEINSLRVTITGGRLNGKKYFSEVMEEYKKSILRIIDEQPTADVVSDIFAEIETLLRRHSNGGYIEEYDDWFNYYDERLFGDIAELKKKYEVNK